MYYATFKNSHFRASGTFLRPGNESEERKLKNANRLPGVPPPPRTFSVEHMLFYRKFSIPVGCRPTDGPPPGRLVVCIHSFGNHLIPKK